LGRGKNMSSYPKPDMKDRALPGEADRVSGRGIPFGVGERLGRVHDTGQQAGKNCKANVLIYGWSFPSLRAMKLLVF
jgi:hypothetical protein